MKSSSGLTVLVLLALITLSIGIQCRAQVARVDVDDLMDVVFDMKKAAITADKLSSDGVKYCGWGVAPLDASDLDLVISRSLLNHGSIVPEEISASKMWRVSFVAEGLINQLEMGLQECALGVRLRDGARSVDVAARPVLVRFFDARFRFDRQAYQQTAWQETKHSKPSETDEGTGAPGVDANSILGVLREVREAWKAANDAVVEADSTKECAHGDSPTTPDEPVELDKLIDRLSRVSHSGNYIPAADMWLVAITTETQKLAVTVAIESCAYYAIGKKKAERAATESFHSYQRLRAALAKFDALALKQTEWEEQVFQIRTIIREN
jgi:hypothetical protein